MNADQKLEKIINMLEEQEVAQLHRNSIDNRTMVRDLILNTVLASTVGFFIFKILNLHFGNS